MSDLFQERYLKHQEKKKKLINGELIGDNKLYSNKFPEIINTRSSQRIFNNKKLTKKELDYIKYSIQETPSSCNRQGVQVRIIDAKKIGDLLVGGVNWASKANKIILLLADMACYKSPNERDFMPYLDAGFIGMSIYYACESIGVGCCFINPNIREENKEEFNNKFNKEGFRFCGALAIGNYDRKIPKTKKSNKIFL